MLRKGYQGWLVQNPTYKMYQAIGATCINRSIHPVRTQMIQLELTTIKMTGESHDKTYVSLVAMQAWL